MTFLVLPSCSTTTSTTSPFLRYTGVGFIPIATPEGVPVIITVPFSRVVPWLTKLTMSRTENSMSFVFESCRTSPFTRVCRRRLSAAPTSCSKSQSLRHNTCSCRHWFILTFRETSTGPRTANLSKPLLKHHCGTPPAKAGSRCHFRQEISLEAT